MDVCIYMNHLIYLDQRLIVKNQGNNVGCAIKCGQVLSSEKYLLLYFINSYNKVVNQSFCTKQYIFKRYVSCFMLNKI